MPITLLLAVHWRSSDKGKSHAYVQYPSEQPGLQTTIFVKRPGHHSQRWIVRQMWSARLWRNGSVNKIVDILDIDCPVRWINIILDQIPATDAQWFIGPKNINELPWRESIADVVTIDEDSDGRFARTLSAALQVFIGL